MAFIMRLAKIRLFSIEFLELALQLDPHSLSEENRAEVAGVPCENDHSNRLDSFYSINLFWSDV